MITTRFTLLVAAALTAALAACSTPTAVVDPTSTTIGSTTSTSVSATGEIATTPLFESTTDVPATSVTSDPPTAEVSPTAEASSPVEGFGLAQGDIEDAKMAWDAYLQFRAFYVQAAADPGADWTTELAALTNQPARSNLQTALTNYSKLQTKVSDNTVTEITKIEVDPDFVVFAVCLDAAGTKFFDKDGIDITAPDAPGSYLRHPGEVWMERQNGVWMFVDSKNEFQTQC